MKMVCRPALYIASLFYGAGVRGRNFLFEHRVLGEYRSVLPVICVGNITVGGTGKTPLVRYLVKLLREQGQSPVVLSRGYGGTQRGPWRILAADTFDVVGDEPMMLARDSQLPVVVSRSRVAGVKFIEAEQLGSVIILDDGFQHRWLARDLNIVCVDGSSERACREFVNGELLPLGRFREPRLQGLKRASIVVVSSRTPRLIAWESNPVQQLVKSLPSGLEYTGSHIGKVAVRGIALRDILAPQKVVALCAIANPEGFFSSLNQLGFADIVTCALPDHSPDVVGRCREYLERSDLPIVITEKDAVKLPPDLVGNQRIYLLSFELELESPDLLAKKIAELLRKT